MASYTQRNPLGADISTSEIVDNAVTEAKLSSAVVTKLDNSYHLVFPDDTAASTTAVGWNTIKTFTALPIRAATDWLMGVAINLEILHTGDHSEDQIRVQIDKDGAGSWVTVWQVTGFANMTDRRLFIARQDFTDSDQTSDAVTDLNVRVQAGAGSGAAEGYNSIKVNLIMGAGA